jgi:hypothetical protein
MTLTEQRDATATDTHSRYAMGELTVAKEGDGWIVLEDGHRVGGTLRYLFISREDAERHVRKELADNADPDSEYNAEAKIIRETDPEIWARYEEVADRDEGFIAHEAAGTARLHVRLCLASLEAKGRITRRQVVEPGVSALPSPA